MFKDEETPKPKPGPCHLHVKLAPDVMRKLRAKSKSLGVPVSAMIRMAIAKEILQK